MIRVVVCRTGQEPVTAEIAHTLEAMQAVVGGYIEVHHLGCDIQIVCNEDGMAGELPQNRCGILGDFFFAKSDDEGEFVSLSEAEVARVLSYAAAFKGVRHGGEWPEVHSFDSLEDLQTWMDNRAFDEEHRN